IVQLRANNFLRWTHELHRFKGNLLFSDGHVEELNGPNLMAAVKPSQPALDFFLPSVPPSNGTGLASSSKPILPSPVSQTLSPQPNSSPSARGSHTQHVANGSALA